MSEKGVTRNIVSAHERALWLTLESGNICLIVCRSQCMCSFVCC